MSNWQSNVPVGYSPDAERIYQLVKTAILNKQSVTAMYRGLRREMSPHVIGTKNGRQQALFYQYAGESSSGLAVDGSTSNWRCIPIAGLSDVAVISGQWHTAPNHSRPQTCVDEIDVEVRL